MGRLRTSASGRVEEGARVAYLPASERDTQVAALDNPWVANEGPLEASFGRGESEPLQPRGLAFDDQTTVVWDEDAVQVVHTADPEPGVVALRSRVIVRERFPSPRRLWRIDYLRRGALLASRYATQGATDA